MTAADELRQELMLFSENMAPIRELVVGYKRQLEKDGIHSVSADRMAEQLHEQILKQAFGTAKK